MWKRKARQHFAGLFHVNRITSLADFQVGKQRVAPQRLPEGVPVTFRQIGQGNRFGGNRIGHPRGAGGSVEGESAPRPLAAAHSQHRVQLGGRFLGTMGGKGHIQVQVVFVKLLRVRGLLIGGQAQLPLDAAAVPTVVPLAVGGLAAEKEGHGQRLFLLAVSHGEGRFAVTSRS